MVNSAPFLSTGGTKTLCPDPLGAHTRDNEPSGNAFDPHLDGERLRFRYADGAYQDAETGSRWSLSGVALNGPLAGAQLAALPSRSAFWFSYRSAFPEVVVFDVGGFEAGAS